MEVILFSLSPLYTESTFDVLLSKRVMHFCLKPSTQETTQKDPYPLYSIVYPSSDIYISRSTTNRFHSLHFHSQFPCPRGADYFLLK